MRTVFLLPLAALVTVTGCGSGREQATRPARQRDLTLQTQGQGVEIASAVELQQLRTPYRVVRTARRISRQPSTPRSSPTQPEPAPAPVPVAPATVVPTPAPEPVSDHELPPGKTVTVIPASGPATEPGWTDEAPRVRGASMGGHVGGGCRGGRGRPATGGAPAPRPDFR